VGIWYSTLEAVRRSLEVNHSSRADRLIKSKIDAASFGVESLTHRRFYPELKTVTFDYPNFQYSPSWRLWLGSNELVTRDDLVLRSGAIVIDDADILLRRSDGKDEPPYTHIELDLDSDASFGQGSTWQEDIQVTGHFGYKYDWTEAGELAGAINASVTTVDIAPVDGSLGVEVGSLLMIGDERMVTVDRRSLDTTINTAGTLDANMGDTLLAVTDGTAFAVDETILVDSERMLIADIAGNNLIVERAYDGTVLADHLSGVDIYALRRFTVQRGALGTTAASHNSGDSVSVFVYPGLVEELATGEAIVLLAQSTGAFAANRGAGESSSDPAGEGLPDLRDRCYTAHGRKLRVSAI
jgi:hypothetical protein